MSDLMRLLITFVIVIEIIDIIVISYKKRKNRNPKIKKNYKELKNSHKIPEKKMFKEIANQIEIDRELKKIEEDRPIYAIPKKIIYKHSDTIHPENEGIIRWNKAFLKSLEWKRYEEVCMEYLKIKNCAADVTCIGADGGIDIKIKDKNGNMLAIGQCKAWNKPIGVSLVRELYGVMASDHVKHGIF